MNLKLSFFICVLLFCIAKSANADEVFAHSKSLNMSFMAKGSTWCKTTIDMHVTTNDANKFDSSGYLTLIKKLGYVLPQECSQANVLSITGLVDGQIVWSGRAEKATGWKAQKNNTVSNVHEKQLSKAPKSSKEQQQSVASLKHTQKNTKYNKNELLEETNNSDNSSQMGDPVSGSWYGKILNNPVELVIWPNLDKKLHYKAWFGYLYSPRYDCLMEFRVSYRPKEEVTSYVTFSSYGVNGKNNCMKNLITSKQMNIIFPYRPREFSIINRRSKARIFGGNWGTFSQDAKFSELEFQFMDFQFSGVIYKRRNVRERFKVSLSRGVASNKMLGFIKKVKKSSKFVKPLSKDIALLKTKKRSASQLYTLGRNYTEDVNNFTQNIQAAQQGENNAQFTIGYAYYEGYGVKKDVVEAKKWFLKSAKQGNSSAMFNLALIYHLGIGNTNIDYKKSRNWYIKSAEAGSKLAQYNMGLFYHRGQAQFGFVKNFHTAFNWYLKAADNNLYIAHNNIGVMFKNGEGVPKDPWLAYLWYYYSAEGGDKTGLANKRAMKAKILSKYRKDLNEELDSMTYEKMKQLTLTAKSSGKSVSNMSLTKKRPSYFDTGGNCGFVSCADEDMTNAILINYYY